MSTIFAAAFNMAAPTQIVLIIACAAILVECRLRGKLKQQKNIQEINLNAATEQMLAKIKINDDRTVPGLEKTFDSDAVIFPSDNDDKVYPDVNKIVSEISTKSINKDIQAARTTDTPLLPKVVLAKEAKEVFTNPITTDEETFKPMENIETSTKPIQETAEARVTPDANVFQESLNLKLVNITKVENVSNDTSNANETVPDFSSRFGETGNHMLVPVNNVQTYQPIPTSNIPANLQGNTPQYGYNDQGNIMNPMNFGGNSQYASPNANIGTNPQHFVQNTVLQNDENAVPNANYNNNIFPQGTSYVPITVSNTYLINGQLYAAVTIPNNMNVPNSIYLINKQLPQSYQVPNNLPVYKFVAGDQGNNVNNV